MIKYIKGGIKNLFNPGVSLLAQIDDKSTVDKNAMVYRFAKVACSSIGAYSYVGGHTDVVHADIGKFCSIAGGCNIGMATHTLDNISTSPIFTERHNATTHSWVDDEGSSPYKRVKIGNDVWIGQRVMVIGGVHIGNGAVIAAGAVVTKDVPPYAVVGGVPAKVIRYRFSPDEIARLEESRWWELPDEVLKSKIEFFRSKASSHIIDEFFDSIDGKEQLPKINLSVK